MSGNIRAGMAPGHPIIPVPKKTLLRRLDSLYEKYNHRSFVHPDPLEFLYDFPEVRDREIVALIASSLAYGRVETILNSVERILAPMRPSPWFFLIQTETALFEKIFDGFVHRFAKTEHIAGLLTGTRNILYEFGSVRQFFQTLMNSKNPSLLPALEGFVQRITLDGRLNIGHLLPVPSRGSACKRLFLFLRWMIRKDAVDPGGWDGISPSHLIVPLDVHMHRLANILGFTQRKTADMKTAIEVTEKFRELCPEDPVRYDFSLTRLGIRKDTAYDEIFQIFR